MMLQHAQRQGRRILIVEDLFLVAEELSDTLRDWGCEVSGPAARVGDALDLVAHETLDGALLDVNLGDERCFPIAQALRARRVPFIFLTGYDMSSAFPPEFENVPRLPKPVNLRRLSALIEEHFTPEQAGC